MEKKNLKINNLGKMSAVKQSIITAFCIALCVVLPMAFHSIPQAGMIYCPMHIPVLICGIVCAPQYAVICGLAGPILSSVITGMPNAAILPSMLVELVCYAFISSLLMKFVHTKKSVADLYISLIGALLIGRVVAGIVKALIFSRGEITIATWATSYFVTCLPGIVMQIVLVPVVYAALVKANLIASRYVYEAE